MLTNVDQISAKSAGSPAQSIQKGKLCKKGTHFSNEGAKLRNGPFCTQSSRQALSHTKLHFSLQNLTKLRCAVLQCTAPYCTVPYIIFLYYTVLYCTVLICTGLHSEIVFEASSLIATELYRVQPISVPIKIHFNSLLLYTSLLYTRLVLQVSVLGCTEHTALHCTALHCTVYCTVYSVRVEQSRVSLAWDGQSDCRPCRSEPSVATHCRGRHCTPHSAHNTLHYTPPHSAHNTLYYTALNITAHYMLHTEH